MTPEYRITVKIVNLEVKKNGIIFFTFMTWGEIKDLGKSN